MLWLIRFGQFSRGVIWAGGGGGVGFSLIQSLGDVLVGGFGGLFVWLVGCLTIRLVGQLVSWLVGW